MDPACVESHGHPVLQLRVCPARNHRPFGVPARRLGRGIPRHFASDQSAGQLGHGRSRKFGRDYNLARLLEKLHDHAEELRKVDRPAVVRVVLVHEVDQLALPELHPDFQKRVTELVFVDLAVPRLVIRVEQIFRLGVDFVLREIPERGDHRVVHFEHVFSEGHGFLFREFLDEDRDEKVEQHPVPDRDQRVEVQRIPRASERARDVVEVVVPVGHCDQLERCDPRQPPGVERQANREGRDVWHPEHARVDIILRRAPHLALGVDPEGTLEEGLVLRVRCEGDVHQPRS
mmetsp:Transcript_39309/g.93028  ORF Transcript_39309/g.93028 Transcript_39309/m.93028 type:complete len:289 (-) Transcript_39309:329-1195(-)